MEQYPHAELAAQNLLHNRERLGRKLGIGETSHTPPAENHYEDIYEWDSYLAAIMNARAGGPWVRAAKNELFSVTYGQQENGFIANIQYAENGRKFDLEKILAFDKSANGSNYTQAPILALSVNETFRALESQSYVEADLFLNSIYPRVAKLYKYFEDFRSNGPEDKLIGVIHPHETGRDSDPTFDFIKPRRLQRSGVETSQLVNKLNTVIDYASVLSYGRKIRGASLEEVRDVFWVNDVMMNCMYADNLYQVAELAKKNCNFEDSKHFQELAETVEAQILDKMWFPEARGGQGMFYALNKDGTPIQEISVSNLFPLVLPNLKEEQLEAVLDCMDQSFNVPFPLPSVATDSPNYDPHNSEVDRLWRGPVWMNMNWYLVEQGLKKQMTRPELAYRPDLLNRCLQWERRIISSSLELLNKNGPREHYDPITAEGQRNRVKNFAWSNLAYFMLETGVVVDLSVYRAAESKIANQQPPLRLVA
jgi:hypothetical protein